MSRKGHKHKPGFEGGQMKLVRRLPKRGFTSPRKRVWAPVNIGDLSKFDAETEVTASVLRARGLGKGNSAGIKILGRGEIDKKLVVKVQAFSTSARAKIEAAGGVCEVVKD
jgi:large subunit ribosomal protein L15